MSDGKVVIDVEANVDRFKHGIAGLGKVAGSAMGALGAAVAGGTAAIATGLGIIAGKSVMLASNLAEVQNVVDTTFGANSKAVSDWAQGAMESYGLSELAGKKYTSTLGAMMKSQGLSADATRDMSTTLAGLSGDFASFYNLAPEEAFEKIRAGISGESEPLKQLGIDLSETAVASYAASQGITKAFSEMSAGEKTTLRYQALMAQTGDAQGDFTRTSDSFANQLRILQGTFENLGASLGGVLLPFANQALGAIGDLATTLTPAFQQTFDGLAGILSGDAGGEAKFQKGIDGIITGLADAITEALPGVITAFVSLLTAVANALPGIITTLTPVLVQGFSTLVQALPEILPPLMEALSTLITELASQLGLMLPELIPVLVDALVAMVDVLILNKDKWVEAAQMLIGGLAIGLWEALPELLMCIVNLAATIIMFIAGLFGIKSPSTVFADFGKNMIEGLKQGLVNAWVAVSTWFGQMKAKVLAFFVGAVSWLSAKGSQLIQGLKTAITTKWTEVTTWLASIGTKVLTAIGDVSKLLSDAGNKIIQGLWDGMKALWEDCKGWVTGIADWIKTNKGPLDRDKRLLEPAGRAIMAGLLAGLESGWKPVETLLQGYTASLGGLGGGLTAALAVSPGFVPAGYSPALAGAYGGGSSGSGGPGSAVDHSVHVTFNTPVASYSDTVRAVRDASRAAARA